MKIYNLKCPNCGATLTTDVKNDYAKCQYCGNEFIISEATEPDARHTSRDKEKDAAEKEAKEPEKNPAAQKEADNPEKRKTSRIRDLIIVLLIVAAGLFLSMLLDKEKPHDIVPKTDLHRFFMELRLDSTAQDVETLAQKHKLHFFRTEKMINSVTANVIYYKVAKTNETVLSKQGEHAETVEIEFDMTKDNAFKLAVYTDPEHITARALLFKYGTYYSLSTEEAKTNDFAGYYYYNNSLRSAPGEQEKHPPYLKCANATEALKKVYTYKK